MVYICLLTWHLWYIPSHSLNFCFSISMLSCSIPTVHVWWYMVLESSLLLSALRGYILVDDHLSLDCHCSSVGPGLQIMHNWSVLSCSKSWQLQLLCYTGMKLPRLKFQVPMITVSGILLGIQLDIYFAGLFKCLCSWEKVW